MRPQTPTVQRIESESTQSGTRWRSIPLGVRMMFVVAGALFAMAFTMLGVQAQTTQSNTVCLPVALPLSGAETRAVNSEPTLNFEGSRASFWSTANPLGDNTDRSIEIFVADTSSLTGTTAPPINQVTVSRGNILGGFNVMPDMLTYVVGGVRHSLIVFASDRDYEPADSPLSNSEGGFEIFLAQTEPTVKIWQLTDTSRSASIMPTISNIIPSFNGQDGRFVRIAYLSDADGAEQIPQATNNADRNYEVHTMLVNLTPLEMATPGRPTLVNGQQFQLTRTSLDTVNDQPTVSANGTHVVFLSNASAGIAAVNTLSNADRNREVFVATVAASPTFIQVTKSSTGDNDAPDISDNGTRVAFASTVTNYPANAATPGTTAGAQSVYLARLDNAGVTGFSRISSAVRAPNGTSAAAHPITAKEPALSNDGRRVVFSANGCDPSVTANACNQPAGLFQVFVVDQQSSSQTAFTMARVTNSITRTHELPSLSGNGQRIALVTTQESSVDNPDLSGSEIVALECRQALLGAAMSMTTVSGALFDNRPDVGDTVAFRVTLENTTFVDFSGTMVMTNTLPPGMTFLNATKISEPAGSTINIGLFNASTRKLVWTVTNLAKLTDATIEIRARVNALEAGLSKTNIVNIATDADLEAQGITNFIDSASVDYRVTQVDLRSSLAVNNTLPRENEVYTYTISVTNPLTVAPGSSGRAAGMDPATKVVVSTTLATLLNQMQFVGTSSSGAVGAVAFNTSTGAVTVDRVNPGTTAQVRVGFRPLSGAGGQAPRTVSITGIRSDQEDIAAGNNIGTASRVIRVVGTDLANVSLTPNQTIPPQGSTIVYAFTVRNRGPLPNTPNPPTDALATGTNADKFAPPFVRARALLPPGIAVTAISDGGAAVASPSGTEVNWNFAASELLEIGENHTLFITGTVTAGPGENLTVQAGDLQALYDPSGLQIMNDPVAGNNGLLSNTVKVNSTAQIGNLTPPDIDEGRSITLTIRYTDTDIADTHVIQVNWGDGSPSNTSPVLTRPISSTTGVYVVPHVYADDPPGINTSIYTLAITVTDNTGNAVTSHPSLEVRNVKPTQTYFNITGNVGMDPLNPTAYLALVGQPISMTVRFTDPGFSTGYSSESFNYTVKSGFPEPDVTQPITNVINGAFGQLTRGQFNLHRSYAALRDDPFLLNIYVADDDMAPTDGDPKVVRLVVDQRPVANDDYFFLYEGDTIVRNVLTNDSDNNPVLKVTSHSAPGIQGTLSGPVANGTITYTANVANLAAGELYTATVTYVIADSRNLTATAKAYFVVTGLNEAPVVDLNGAAEGIDIARAFVEDTGPLTLSPAGTVTDNDGQNEIQTLLVTITNPIDGAYELVKSGTFTTVVPSWDAANHVLTITKAGSVTPNWDAVLRSVQYVNDSPDPDPTPRLIQFVATDNSASQSEIATATVSVEAVDDAPIIVITTTVGMVDESQSAPASILVDGSLRISDTDTLVWDGGVLTATVASPAPQDRLQVVSGGLVAVSGANIAYDGVNVATYTGGGTSLLRITFNASSSNEAVQAVARRIAYARASGPVSPNPRTISLVAVSAPGTLPSNTATRNINVTYFNDAPQALLTAPTVIEDTPTNIRANIHITDTDAGNGNVRMNLQVTSGQLRVTGFTGVVNNGTGNLTFTSTVALLDSAGTIIYTPTLDYAGIVTLTVNLNDNGNTGGPAISTSTRIAFDIIDVNDPPDLDLNGPAGGNNTTAAYLEQDPYTSLGTLNATITDIDSANMSALTATIASMANPLQEFMTATVSSNITALYTPATGVLRLTGLAPIGEYQLALRSLRYSNSSDDPGTSRTISVVVADDGGLLTPVRTIALTITPVNDRPVLDLNGPAAGIDYNGAFVEDMGAVPVLSTTATLVDPDNAQLSNIRIVLTNIKHGTAEFLTAQGSGGVSVVPWVTSATTGTLTLQGPAPLASFLTVLQTVRYSMTVDAPITDARVFEFRVTDTSGTATAQNSPFAKTTLTITPTNDPVFIDLDGTTLGQNFVGTFTEDMTANGGYAFAQNPAALTVVDPDGGIPLTIYTATVTLTNPLDGALEELAATVSPPLSQVYNPSTGVLTIVAPQPAGGLLSDFTNALKTVRYRNLSDTPNTTDRIIEYRMIDSALAMSNVPVATMHVVAFNDAPTVVITTATGGIEDTALDLQPFIVVNDVDAGAGNLTLTLTATEGTLNSPGATGNGTAVIAVTGTITQLNSAQLNFMPRLNFNGNASYRASVNDNGNSPAPPRSGGMGPAAIIIAAVNDAPTLTVNAPTTVFEDVATNIRSSIIISDVDAGSNDIRIEVTVNPGTLFAVRTGMDFANNGTSSIVMTGTVAEFASSVISYTSPLNFNGTANLSVTVNDKGHTGSGGEQTVSQGPVSFNVAAVNDPPTVTIAATIAISEDVSTNMMQFVTLDDVDAGSASNIRLIMTVSAGTLTTSSSGVTIVSGNNTNSITVEGTLANLQAAVINFLTPLNSTAANSLSVTLNDRGNTGTGGELTATASRPVTIIAINDAPTVVFTPPTTVQEDVSFNLASAIAVGDVDSGSNLVRMRVQVATGTLTVTTFPALTIEQVTPSQVLITGTITNLDAAAVNFKSAPNMNGTEFITITVNDRGFTGAGGPMITSVGPSPFTVNAVDDPPVIAVNTGITVTGTGTVIAPLTTAMLSATDVDSADSAIIYTVRAVPAAPGVAVRKNGTAMIACNTFTQAELVAGGIIDVSVSTVVPRPTNTNFTFVVGNAANCVTGSPTSFVIRVRAP